MSWLAANATQLIAIGAALVGYIWNRMHVSNVATGNAVADSVLKTIGSLFDAYAASASTAKTLSDVAVELRGLAAVQLGKAGIYEGTPARAVIDAAVNALIAQAIATIVTSHPTPTSLHAEVKAVGLEPINPSNVRLA